MSRSKVYKLLRTVPKGKVTTYKELGSALNIHQRAIAVYMKTNKDPVRYPCYKVIMSSGDIGGYGSIGQDKKIKLIENDGIPVIHGKVHEKYIHRF